MNRRTFLKHSGRAAAALAAFPTVIPATAFGQGAQRSASSRVNVACIGNGPQGQGVMGNFLAQANCRVVAVCDVRRQHREQARDRVNQHYKNQDCRTYADFREVLARPDIDVTLIATPDHWHVPVAIAAAKAGKDMYVEKPLGLTIAEDQLLRKAIHRHGRLFQFGTQQRSSSQFWRACQLVRNGRIGQLRHVDVWSSASRPGGSTQSVPPPEGLDYEFWLGPAPATPYTENKCDAADSKTWWYNYDYALGFIAGWGVHPLDIANWGCPSLFAGLLTVEGTAIFPTEGACNTAVAWEAQFRCHDGVTLRYRGTPNGYNQPTPLTDFADWRKQYGNIVDHGTAFVGTDGWVLVDRTQIRTSPERLVEEKPDAGQVQLLKSDNHAANLLGAVHSRGPTVCPIDESVQADILCHLSDIATRLGRKLTWDPKKERFVKDSEADRRLKLRKMRSPWAL